MSDGGLEDGLEFWATFKIEGSMKKEQLKAVMAAVRDVLGGRVTEDAVVKRRSENPDGGILIEGLVVKATRVANGGQPNLTFSAEDVEGR